MRDFCGSNRLPKARPGPLSGICAVSAIALLSAVPAANATVINVIDVIPNSDSAEARQSSEPSLAVNPFNTSQMIAGSQLRRRNPLLQEHQRRHDMDRLR
jgi:hypothetical protein